MSKKCKTCEVPLWLAWLIMGWPWQKRIKSLKDAEDCIDLLPEE